MRPSCPESSHAMKEPVESCGAFAYSRTIRKPGSWHLHRPNFLNRETGMVKCHLPQGTKFICHISWRKHFASRVDYSCSVVHSISYILTSGMGSGPDMSNHTVPSGSWHDICCVKAKRVSGSKIVRDCKARKICLKICDICHLSTKCIKILTKLSAFFKSWFLGWNLQQSRACKAPPSFLWPCRREQSEPQWDDLRTLTGFKTSVTAELPLEQRKRQDPQHLCVKCWSSHDAEDRSTDSWTCTHHFYTACCFTGSLWLLQTLGGWASFCGGLRM